MKNIIDYARETASKDFKEKPFNDVDSLILSQLSYLNFKGIVPGVHSDKAAISIRDIGKSRLRERLFINSVGEKDNRKLFVALEHSKRFSNIKLHYFACDLDIKGEKQFAAVTFLLDDNTSYIAFRGTDEYIVSWKEDFNMSYLSPVPAQIESLKYMEEVGSKVIGDIMTGGHSKGGNLAIYACIYCAEPIRKRLMAIYSHDGPGLQENIYKEPVYEKLVPIIHKTIPQGSIVGMFLYQREVSKIICSGAYSMMGQHYPFSWAVEKGAFKSCSEIRKNSFIADSGFKNWLQQTDIEKRRFFVDTIYDIFLSANVTNIYEMKNNRGESILRILETAKGIDENNKTALRNILKILLDNMKDAYRN